MEFGDDIIRRCPDCHVLFAQRTWLSANSNGMQQWTDGYWSAHHMNISPVIFYCPFCKKWIPIEDADELFTLPLSGEYNLMPVVELEDGCKAEDYLAALECPRCERIEKTLRIRLWWLQNEKRREGAPVSEDLVLTEALHDNLERLVTLFGPEEGDLRAEALRELGDFTEAMKTLALPDGNGESLDKREPGRTILIQCERENILPVQVGSRPVPVYEEKQKEKNSTGQSVSETHTFNLREVLSQGFYPFPCPEDIFAFPSGQKESENSFLAVDLSGLRDQWSGWAAFFLKEAEHRFKNGRLFTDQEWRTFRRFPLSWREDLKEFWKCTSWNIDGYPDKQEDYYRVRYQLHYGYIDYIDREKIAERQRWFTPFWNLCMNQLMEEKNDLFLWVQQHEARCYWDHLWSVFNDGYPDLTTEKMEETRRESLEREEQYRYRRTRSLDGLRYVELGGFPKWFQGNDKTPVSLTGKKMEFVGQVWTDYLKAGGSALVYVFYDHENGSLAQVYDYD